MSPEELASITAVSGLIAALAALFSAFAAFKSAKHARESSRSAQMAEARLLAREIVDTSHEALRTTARVQDLFLNSISVNRELALFAGQLGGSRQMLLENEVENDKEKISGIVKTINDLFTTEEDLYKLNSEEKNKLLLKINIQMAEVNSIKDKLESKLKALNDEVKPFREKAINH